MTQMVKNLPAMQETQVPSLGQEHSSGEGLDNPLQYSSLEKSVDRGACGPQPMGSQRVGHNTKCIHPNGAPLVFQTIFCLGILVSY